MFINCNTGIKYSELHEVYYPWPFPLPPTPSNGKSSRMCAPLPGDHHQLLWSRPQDTRLSLGTIPSVAQVPSPGHPALPWDYTINCSGPAPRTPSSPLGLYHQLLWSRPQDTRLSLGTIPSVAQVTPSGHPRLPWDYTISCSGPASHGALSLPLCFL